MAGVFCAIIGLCVAGRNSGESVFPNPPPQKKNILLGPGMLGRVPLMPRNANPQGSFRALQNGVRLCFCGRLLAQGIIEVGMCLCVRGVAGWVVSGGKPRGVSCLLRAWPALSLYFTMLLRAALILKWHWVRGHGGTCKGVSPPKSDVQFFVSIGAAWPCAECANVHHGKWGKEGGNTSEHRSGGRRRVVFLCSLCALW